MRYLLLAIVLMLALPALAVEEKYDFANDDQAQLFSELTKELRCPKCQNQNIADSDAVVAKDLRDKVEELVKEGQNKDQVIDYMIDRYGYFVHYQPPVTPATILLWILPGLIVIAGLAFIVLRQKKAAQKASWSAADEQKLQQLIKQYQRKESA
ncbi:cytochrome c-type biogenesis protein [Pseudoalteromonas sp. Cnat2-41]|uniref:cytochrome c-type biogenesis protein n=1 Tax=Pseudoalteromonas TaxID=53246 RepID=UPI00034D83F5|nr:MULTISPECIES: cytochrome c-type biogenesis protein [Pseudoalteromonas]MCF2863506.1 cytochrome c-type biogenesis protein CcmH [Pseudoalteromonas sp. CNAT2-18]MCG7558459.1 cytochrome c-type biogenesis protein CcmH [Pseudoalteromonas sp. CNAT2-18.1]MCG7567611.1 cytochrome c-type biogenesis protein CcmH [Pseudoalteromonas sp. CnMc7-15]TLX50095.1 cytochrome c-type biogenesis protein CcmH [Pseudoalteromonas ruthenica]GAP76147.1 cytochrome c heme lyase subunit CcmL [Pseudoalteromonas sp. SW0106-04